MAMALLASAGCRHGERAGETAAAKTKNEEGSTAGIRVIRAVQRDIRMTVVQPGTLEAFETTPIYSRISGYVERYLYNIGDRVKKGDVLIEMWIPDVVEQHARAGAEARRAKVQIDVAQTALRAAEAKLETAVARVDSAKAGVKRAQASYTRWESEYKRLEQLVTQRVLDVQVRDETYRQFEEAAAAHDQATAALSESKAARDQAEADRDRARVNVEATRAQFAVAGANEREARVNVEYGQIKAPYAGVITQRNVSPGDYLQPGGGTNGRPLFVLEQIDPVRVFVGVPELASFFVNVGQTALIRFQAIPGATREGKVVRSGFSLNPMTRTLQTEIDVPNADNHLRPGWYVTVTITVDRKQVWAVPSYALLYLGGQDYAVFMRIEGKTVRVPVIVGPSDDTYTEILRKYVPGDPRNPPEANTVDWPKLEGTEEILVGNLDVLNQEFMAAQTKGSAEPAATPKAGRR
jgi:multidrug efflux pump subunit AcrA (membrane-fusion protein)